MESYTFGSIRSHHVHLASGSRRQAGDMEIELWVCSNLGTQGNLTSSRRDNDDIFLSQFSGARNKEVGCTAVPTYRCYRVRTIQRRAVCPPVSSSWEATACTPRMWAIFPSQSTVSRGEEDNVGKSPSVAASGGSTTCQAASTHRLRRKEVKRQET